MWRRVHKTVGGTRVGYGALEGVGVGVGVVAVRGSQVGGRVLFASPVPRCALFPARGPPLFRPYSTSTPPRAALPLLGAFSPHYALSASLLGLGLGFALSTRTLSPVRAADENTSADQPKKGFVEEWKQYFGEKFSSTLNDKEKVLLPEMQPPPFSRPFTLVLSDEVLLTREYQPTSGGILTKKRPGVEYFLATLAQNFEIVIFSLHDLREYAYVIDKLDANHHASHRLFLDSTVLRDGKQIKDLSMLGRDLSKVIAIDVVKDATVPADNVIVIAKYDGSMNDRTLLDLLAFFRLMATARANVNDVRLFVKSYERNGIEFFKEKWAKALADHAKDQDARRATTVSEDDDLARTSHKRPFRW